MLQLFLKAGQEKSNNSKYQFWQHHNKPIELWTPTVIRQKIDYIHLNPVKAGFVTEPTAYKYSSARNFAEDTTVLEIDDPGFFGVIRYSK
jgi:putative transposase